MVKKSDKKMHVSSGKLIESLEGRTLFAVDLQGLDMYVSQSSAQWGQAINVSPAEIKNAGSTATGSFRIEWYLSRDTVGSSDDVRLSLMNGSTYYSHSAFGGGGVSGGNFYVDLQLPAAAPSGWSGSTFYVVMKTDSANQVVESNESNNFGQIGNTYDWDSLTISSPVTVPSAPTGVSASDGAYTDKVRVSWNAVANAAGYELWRNTTNSTSSASKLSDVNGTTFDNTTAVAGTTYFYWVKAKNTAGTSGFSSVDSGYRAAVVTAPSAPTDVSATDGAYTDKVRVTWTAPSGATAYEVWRNTSNSSGIATKITSSDVTGTTYDDSTAVAGTTYYYFVKAKNSGGTSGFSASNSGYRATTSTAPANNSFASATNLTGSFVTVSGTNVNATKESGEPNHAGITGGKSVWWKWTAPSSGIVTIDTFGSAFDTILAGYTGSSVSGLTQVSGAANDDSGGTLQSSVTFSAVSGTTYQIAVDGYNAASGNIALRLALAGVPAPSAPTNVAASDGTYTDKVRVTWTAPANATAYEVWRNTSNSTSGATKISASDVTGTTYDDTTAVAGTTYYYFVKAKNGGGTSGFSSSNSGYRATTSAGPANNNFASHATITGSSATVTGTNVNATKESGEPNHAGINGGKSVWWKWTALSSGTVTIDTFGSNFDTILAVYTGSSVSALTQVPGAANDDTNGLQSYVSFAAAAGTTYKIAVDGFNAESGNITLHLSSAVAFANPISNLRVTTTWLARGDDDVVTSDPSDYLPGKVHLGIDYGAAERTSVYAIADGEVVARQDQSSGWGTGNVALAIRHRTTGGDIVAVYGHIRSNLQVGDTVRAGTVFATVGPYSGGSHLHFGVAPGLSAPPITSTSTGNYGWGAGPLSHHDQTNFTNGFVDPAAWMRDYRAINGWV